MSDISVSWVKVSRSAWRQFLQAAAVVVTGGAATAIPLAFLVDSPIHAGLGAAFAMAVAAGCARLTVSRREASWRVGPDGRVWVRWDGVAVSEPVATAFVSPFLIVLRQGRRTLAIWRDAAPAVAFRRLSAAVRWPSPQARTPASNVRPDAADRT